MLLMLLGKFMSSNSQASQETHKEQGRVEDPHLGQTIRDCMPHKLLPHIAQLIRDRTARSRRTAETSDLTRDAGIPAAVNWSVYATIWF
jgi:hypothetical protein